MVSYKELGLVNTREMFKKAVDGGYAIPAFNFNNMEQLQAIIKGCPPVCQCYYAAVYGRGSCGLCQGVGLG